MGIIAIHMSGVRQYLTLEAIKIKSALLSEYVATSYSKAVLFFIAAYCAAVLFLLPGVALLTILGGYLFGAFWGAVYTNIGATLGAVGAFCVVRYVVGSFVQERYAVQLARFNSEFEQQGTAYLLGIHFIAVVPFFLVNILAGLTRVSLWTFMWTTSLGIFPASLVFAFAGKQLHEITSLRDILTPNIIFAFTLIAFLALLPTIVRSITRSLGKRS
jgi:uncharacterized membrane protein YdjX (TVP38/TMEM64 family)